jgi:hypothetical protein
MARNIAAANRWGPSTCFFDGNTAQRICAAPGSFMRSSARWLVTQPPRPWSTVRLEKVGVCAYIYIYTVYTYIYTHTHIPTFSRFMGKLMIIHWITLLLDKPQSIFIPPKFWTRFDLELVHTSGWTQVWCRRSARRRGSTRRVSCTAAQYNYTVDHKLVLTWRC